MNKLQLFLCSLLLTFACNTIKPSALVYSRLEKCEQLQFDNLWGAIQTAPKCCEANNDSNNSSKKNQTEDLTTIDSFLSQGDTNLLCLLSVRKPYEQDGETKYYSPDELAHELGKDWLAERIKAAQQNAESAAKNEREQRRAGNFSCNIL